MLTLYECGICGCVHRWEFDGDCREDAERFDGVEDFEERTGIHEFGDDGRLQIELRSMAERVAADESGR